MQWQCWLILFVVFLRLLYVGYSIFLGDNKSISNSESSGCRQMDSSWMEALKNKSILAFRSVLLMALLAL
jgi:hypothetical protein